MADILIHLVYMTQFLRVVSISLPGCSFILHQLLICGGLWQFMVDGLSVSSKALAGGNPENAAGNVSGPREPRVLIVL